MQPVSGAISWKARLCLGYILFHFSLIVVGAWGWRFEFKAPDLIRLYQAFTGSGYSFSFFAPRIGTEYQAVFELFDTEGRSLKNLKLRPSHSRELELRVGGIINAFRDPKLSQGVRRALAASWANRILRDHEAHSIQVQLQQYYLPTMKEVTKGEKAEWRDFYAAKFEK